MRTVVADPQTGQGAECVIVACGDPVVRQVGAEQCDHAGETGGRMGRSSRLGVKLGKLGESCLPLEAWIDKNN
jgi:hypothetical protein